MHDQRGEFGGTDRFRIVREIGAGGMGVVYEARDRERDVIVAVKRLRYLDPLSLYHFKQEFRALTDVSHPNLVVLHELTWTGGDWLLAMEFVDGVDFLTWVRNGEPRRNQAALDDTMGPGMPPVIGSVTDGVPQTDDVARPLTTAQLRRLRDALRQLCEGVAALHAAGKLHRDIKPTNALVTPQGRVVLLDFGLVTEVESRDRESLMQVVGTPAYMAPEQCAGKPASEANDWYSVGVILYEALTGRAPFIGRPLEIMLDKQRFEPPAAAELVERVPEDLDALCAELLRRDPQRRIGGVEVLRRVGVQLARLGSHDSAPPRSQPSLLVGRGAERAALLASYEQAAVGSAAAVVVRGGSGMGKSTLVSHFLAEVVARDNALVLDGRCYERESVPYKALDSVIDRLARHLAALPAEEVSRFLPQDIAPLALLFPVLERVGAIGSGRRAEVDGLDPHEARRRAFAALRALLRRLARTRRLVIFIDDLQWTDADSGRLLEAVLGGDDAPGLLLIACVRTGGDGPEVLLPGDLEPRIIDVAPLDPANAEALARRLLPERTADLEAVARTIAQESGGNPFFVSELVQALEEGGVDQSDSGPVVLEAVIRRRIDRLPEAARLVLELAAVGDGPTPLGVLRRAAGIDREFDTAAAILRTARLVRAGGGRESDGVEAYHSRIREAALAALAADDRVELHRRLGAAFVAAGDADPERLVLHFQGAGDLGQAIRYAVAAARRAERALAFDRAVELYRLALEMRAEAGEPEGGDARALRVSLADALVYAGRGAEAARQYLQAAEDGPDAERLEHARRAADQYLRSGHVDEAVELLGRLLARHGVRLTDTPRQALPGLLWRRARIRTRGLGFRPRPVEQISPEALERVDLTWTVANVMGFVDTIRGADFQARHLLAALEVGEPMRVARALTTEAAYAAATGPRGRRRARDILARARTAVAGRGQPYVEGVLRFAGALTTFFEERWADARAEMDASADWFRDRCRGVIWEINSARGFSLWCSSYLGELDDLRERAPEYLADARARGDRYAIAGLSAAVPNLAWLVDDRPDEARAVVSEAMERWSERGFHVQHYYELVALTNIDLYEGQGQSAWHRITQRWPALARSLLLRIPQIRTELTWCRARAAVAAAAAGSAPIQAVERAARDLRSGGTGRAPYLAELIRAEILVLRSQRAEAIGAFERAMSGLEAREMPVWAAAAQRRIAELEGDHARVADLDKNLAKRGARRPARFYAILAPAST